MLCISVRTIFWPPGPLPLRYDSSISESGGGFGRGGRFFKRMAPRVLKDWRLGMALADCAMGKVLTKKPMGRDMVFWSTKSSAKHR